MPFAGRFFTRFMSAVTRRGVLADLRFCTRHGELLGTKAEFFRHGVYPAVAERIASENPPKCQITALNRTKPPNGSKTILGTGWIKAAARR